MNVSLDVSTSKKTVDVIAEVNELPSDDTESASSSTREENSKELPVQSDISNGAPANQDLPTKRK